MAVKRSPGETKSNPGNLANTHHKPHEHLAQPILYQECHLKLNDEGWLKTRVTLRFTRAALRLKVVPAHLIALPQLPISILLTYAILNIDIKTDLGRNHLTRSSLCRHLIDQLPR